MWNHDEFALFDTSQYRHHEPCTTVLWVNLRSRAQIFCHLQDFATINMSFVPDIVLHRWVGYPSFLSTVISQTLMQT
jgi:hypothetical protein